MLSSISYTSFISLHPVLVNRFVLSSAEHVREKRKNMYSVIIEKIYERHIVDTFFLHATVFTWLMYFPKSTHDVLKGGG